MLMERAAWGRTESGEEVTAYKFGNGLLTLTALTYGATLQSLQVPDRDGRPCDVVLGYDSLHEYETQGGFVGASIGRVCNRIARGRFSLAGQDYQLPCNDGPNHLHGGPEGFHARVWQAEELADGLRFFRTSADGEAGYPGCLQVSVCYLLSGCELHIVYDARSDRDTLCSLTNHSYFNLAGSGDILDHRLSLEADFFTENDASCLPTGRLLPAAGAFDFRTPKAVGRDIASNDTQLQLFGGYDHNFALRGAGRQAGRQKAAGLHKAASLTCERSGIGMEVRTTLPGLQLYTGNSLTPRRGKGGALGLHSGLCLETQFFPNAVNCPAFASPLLRAGDNWHQETHFCFSRL